MKKIWIAIGVLSVLGVGGYFGYQWVQNQRRLLTNFCFKFGGVKVNKLSLNQVSIEITISIKNRSNIDLVIDGYTFDISIEGNKLTTITAKESVSLQSMTWSTFPIKIDLNPKDIGKNILNPAVLAKMLGDLDNTTIGISGYISAAALGIDLKHLPINVSLLVADMKPGSAPKSPDPAKVADCT
jgi:LEA14-like dessication related protein